MRSNREPGADLLQPNAEERRVHAWRVTQLVRLGLDWPAAEEAAESVDWHEVARLVARGCPPDLAVEILN